MSDLISKAELFNALATAKDKADCFAVIQAAPTVDAVPARHGHWTEDGDCDVKIAYDYVSNYKHDIEERLVSLKKDPTQRDKFNLALSDLLCDILPKRIPKKPIKDKRYRKELCPVCNDFVRLYGRTPMLFCCNCGQALDWEDEK